jgi:hypothetical protein
MVCPPTKNLGEFLIWFRFQVLFLFYFILIYSHLAELVPLKSKNRRINSSKSFGKFRTKQEQDSNNMVCPPTKNLGEFLIWFRFQVLFLFYFILIYSHLAELVPLKSKNRRINSSKSFGKFRTKQEQDSNNIIAKVTKVTKLFLLLIAEKKYFQQ